jgi:hypothetical protein
VTVTTRSGPPDARDLAAADVVILEDLPFPAGAAGERLAAFVRGGGGLVQVLGPGASGRWPAGLPEFAVGDVVDRDAAGGGTFGVLRREHPVFEPFRGPGSGDFAAARIFRYRRVRGDSLDVLASYDDGAPALLEGAAGAGRLLVLTSPADNVWSDLPLQPVFLPLAHQLVLHAAGYVERPPAHAVGEVATVAEGLGGEAVVIVTPSGDRTRREAGTGPVAVTVAEAGFHEVREARAGGRLLALLAGNSPAEEANLASFDPEDLMVAAGARDSVSRMAAAVPAEDLTALERERAQGLWWYLLAGALLLLAVEALLANRLAGFVGAETQAAPEAS